MKPAKNSKHPVSADSSAAPQTALPPAAGNAYRDCPCCCDELGRRGRGEIVSTKGAKSYYRCGRCGHTWTATFVRRREFVARSDAALLEAGNVEPVHQPPAAT